MEKEMLLFDAVVLEKAHADGLGGGFGGRRHSTFKISCKDMVDHYYLKLVWVFNYCFVGSNW